MLVDESVEHRSPRGRVKQLDVFRYWNELWERGHEVMKTVTRGHTFTHLTGAHLKKTAGPTLRQPALADGLNQAVKKELAAAGIRLRFGQGRRGHDGRRPPHNAHLVRGTCSTW
jgi:hypothetical protein